MSIDRTCGEGLARAVDCFSCCRSCKRDVSWKKSDKDNTDGQNTFASVVANYSMKSGTQQKTSINVRV